jgi:hypothetical protein
MKAAKIFFSIGLILGCLVTGVRAETSQKNIFGENVSLSLGINTWRATFETQTFQENGYLREGVEATSNMFGVSCNLILYKKYYLGGNYYSGGGFDDTAFDYYTDQEVQHIFEYEFEKTDMDIWIGYYLHPRISAFIGYKKIETDGQLKWHTRTASTKYDETIEGPVFGVAINFPLADSGFTFFSTLGYATLDGKADYDLKWTDVNGNPMDDIDSASFDSLGPALEFGILYLLEDLPHFSITVKYKYQEYKDPDIDNYSTKLYGFNIGANFHFYPHNGL